MALAGSADLSVGKPHHMLHRGAGSRWAAHKAPQPKTAPRPGDDRFSSKSEDDRFDRGNTSLPVPQVSPCLCSSPLSPGEGLAGALMRNRWASLLIRAAPEIVNANCYLLFCHLPFLLFFFFNNESHLRCALFAHQKSLIRNPFRNERLLSHVYSRPLIHLVYELRVPTRPCFLKPPTELSGD